MIGKMETLEQMVKWIDREREHLDDLIDLIDAGEEHPLTVPEIKARHTALTDARNALMQFNGLWDGSLLYWQVISKPVAEHQGKNIWRHGRKFTTCSETFSTLKAAKRYLDRIYKARESKAE